MKLNHRTPFLLYFYRAYGCGGTGTNSLLLLFQYADACACPLHALHISRILQIITNMHAYFIQLFFKSFQNTIGDWNLNHKFFFYLFFLFVYFYAEFIF